ncbi:MAG: dUTP diphosphatase [Phycisphaerae bacterium]
MTSRRVWGIIRGVETVQVQIKRLPGHEDVPLPCRMSAHAAGFDLHAAVPAEAPVTLQPGDIALIPCGFAMAVPPGYEAQVRPRSGLATRFGISMPNAPGTIDADYRGEVKVPLINLGRAAFVVERGMRIAQMLVLPVPDVTMTEVLDLPPTERGEGGFGSSGLSPGVR